jgi:predicted ATPase/DNA-binding CsgD family transcriptional regulator
MATIALEAEKIWKLPVTLTSFIGREQEITKICAMLQRTEVYLLTLLGSGGIGKTRLAIQVATALQKHFVDGVCFISLATISEPAFVFPTIAQELGIQELGEQPIFEQVKVALRTKHLLLLLDNFEHVIEAAPLLTELLAACPQLKILVTSRAVLHIQGEHEYLVPPLTVPDLHPLPSIDTLRLNAAMTLFMQRAQATRPDFQLTQANAKTIAEICVRLDGLPLAIELAASRIKLLSPQALLAKLQHRFNILTNGTHDLPLRQQTLQNTIAWSYHLLDAKEQQLFRCLSVFSHGCTLEAIENIEAMTIGTNDAGMLDRISSLLDKSLILTELEGEEVRIVMLETLREYGQERLNDHAETEIIRRAHTIHYLKLVEEAEPYLKGAQQILWMTRLEREQENLRAALEWLLQQKETALAMRFCAALGWFWHLHRDWREGRYWLEAMLALPDAEDPTAARAKVLYSAGDLAYYQDDYVVACTRFEQSEALCRELDLKRELAITLSDLGMLLHVQGNYARVGPLLAESEQLSRVLESKWELSHLLRKSGRIAWSQGNLIQAIAYTEEGLSLARAIGDVSLISTTLSIVSGIAMLQGDFAQATTRTEESLILAQQLNDKYLIATAMQNLGYLAAHDKDLIRASSLAQEALSLFRELGDKLFIAIALNSLGYIASLQGNMNQAEASYQEALLLSLELGNNTRVSWDLIGLAGVAEAKGCYQRAACLLGVAEGRFDINGNMNASERADYEQLVERIRAGSNEKDFTAAWNEGRHMTPQQALTFRERHPLPQSPVVSQSQASHSYPAGLTTREVEVLRLVAEGLTDVQVAAKLIISPRTVNWHLGSVYSKLAISSRSAATRYAVEQHLV